MYPPVHMTNKRGFDFMLIWTIYFLLVRDAQKSSKGRLVSKHVVSVTDMQTYWTQNISNNCLGKCLCFVCNMFYMSGILMCTGMYCTRLQLNLSMISVWWCCAASLVCQPRSRPTSSMRFAWGDLWRRTSVLWTREEGPIPDIVHYFWPGLWSNVVPHAVCRKQGAFWDATTVIHRHQTGCPHIFMLTDHGRLKPASQWTPISKALFSPTEGTVVQGDTLKDDSN